MILDLDGFKTINDTLGHMTGDAVLAEFAKRLCKAFENKQNPLNRVYRMGGDEFAVIVHGMEKEQAVRVAREAIARFVVTGPDEEKLPVSASVGAAHFRSSNPNDTATTAVSAVMAEADEEVYQDKAFKIERLEEVLKASCVTEMFASMQLG
jgi:diguanylate cyclase (GGDEF)-like protein